MDVSADRAIAQGMTQRTQNVSAQKVGVSGGTVTHAAIDQQSSDLQKQALSSSQQAQTDATKELKDANSQITKDVADNAKSIKEGVAKLASRMQSDYDDMASKDAKTMPWYMKDLPSGMASGAPAIMNMNRNQQTTS